MAPEPQSQDNKPKKERVERALTTKDLGKWVGLVSTVASAGAAALAAYKGHIGLAILACGGVIFGIVLLSLLGRVVEEAKTSQSKFWDILVKLLTAFVLLYFIALAAIIFPDIVKIVRKDLNSAEGTTTGGSGAEKPKGATDQTKVPSNPSGPATSEDHTKSLDKGKGSATHDPNKDKRDPGSSGSGKGPQTARTGTPIVRSPVVHSSNISPAEKAKELNSQAKKLAEGGNYAASIPLLDEAIRIYPQVAHAHYNRGLNHYYLGEASSDNKQYELALTDLDESIKRDSGDALNFYVRGLAHYQLGHFQLALNDFDRAYQLKPEKLTGDWRDAAKKKLDAAAAAGGG